MSSGKTWHDVLRASETLPDDKLHQVLTLIDQLPEADRPPLELVETIRRKAGLGRRAPEISLKSILFHPVEDLFDPPALYRRRIGRLSRAVVDPTWELVSADLDSRTRTELSHAASLLVPSDECGILAVGDELWSRGADTLRRLLTGSRTDRQTAEQHLGKDDDVWRQVGDFASILEIGGIIERIKLQLPQKPIDTLSDAHGEVLRTAVLDLVEQGVAKVRTLILVLIARMKQPGLLIDTIAQQLRANLSPKEQDTLFHDVGSSVFADMERKARSLDTLATLSSTPYSATALARQLVEGLTSLETSLAARQDPQVHKSIRRVREHVAEFTQRHLLKDADTKMRTLLDTAPLLAAAGDDDRADQIDDTVDAAELLVLSLRHCRAYADAVGIDRPLKEKTAAVRAHLEDHDDPTRPPDEREQRLMLSVRLLERLVDPNYAHHFFKQGMEKIKAPTG